MGSTTPSDAPATPPGTTVLGVLGGIASGKSAVARLLAGEGGRVVSADRFAQEALDTPEVQERLVAEFGSGVVDAAGRTDREALARRVFADAAARERLEGWIHPLVRERILADLADARSKGVARVVLDVPLLLENDEQHGLARLCDYLVFVDTSPAERDRRATLHRDWQSGEVERRESAQLPIEHKRRRAHYRVSNDGTLEELAVAIRDVLREVGFD